MPVYTDEIVWKFLQDRYFYDGARTMSAFPECGVTDFSIPWMLVPFRRFDAAIYQDISGPAMIRTVGVGLALFWGVTSWGLLRRSTVGVLSAWQAAGLVIAVATLGTMPSLLVTNRPEQVLLIGMTMCSLPLLLERSAGRRSIAADIGIGVILTVLSGYLFATHPRSIFALPLVLLFVNHVFSRKSVAVVVGLAATILCLTAVADWGLRSQCEDPTYARKLSDGNLLVAVTNGLFHDFLHASARQFLRQPDRWLYLEQFRIDHSVTSNELLPLKSAWATASGVLTEAVFAAMVTLGAAAFVALALRVWRQRRASTRELALAALWAFYAASLVTRAGRYVYEESVIEPVLAMASLGSIWAARDMLEVRYGIDRLRRWTKIGFATLIATSAISQIVLILGYLPQASGAWSVPGYMPNQRFSISVAGYESLRSKIVETARMCGIDPAQHPRHVIVDELTSFALEPISRPFFAPYIAEHGWGSGITDYRAFLTKIGSGGMVVGCQWLPEELRDAAVRNGQFCCLPSFVQSSN